MLQNMRIGLRSSLAFGVIGLLMLVLGGLSLVQLKQLNTQITVIATERVPSLQRIDEINKAFLQVRLYSLVLIHTADEATRQSLIARINQLEREMNESASAYQSLILSTEDKQLFDAFKRDEARYWALNHESRALSAAGDVAAAAELSRVQMSAVGDELMANLAQLSALLETRVASANAKTDAIYGQSQLLIGFIIVLALLGMVALALLLTRSIVQPLSDAVQVAKTIAAGNLTQHIAVKGRDEPAQLMQALAEMRSSLQQTVQHITDSSVQLASTSEELSLVTKDASQGLQQQNQQLEQAVTAVTEMTSAVEEVARNAADTSRESEMADERTQFGRDRVGSTLSSIEVLASDINVSMEDINVLASQIDQITQVLDVIQAIAEQTNLLALNAAIEAARAGESGRGFAVVADEVRALAHRTQESTTEIEKMIKAVQSSSRHAVTAMQNSNTRSTETLAMAREAGEALGEIASAIALINDRNLAIASAAEQQALVSSEVDRNLNNIQDVSAQSAAGADQTSASSLELAKLAGELNTLVNRFAI